MSDTSRHWVLINKEVKSYFTKTSAFKKKGGGGRDFPWTKRPKTFRLRFLCNSNMESERVEG